MSNEDLNQPTNEDKVQYQADDSVYDHGWAPVPNSLVNDFRLSDRARFLLIFITQQAKVFVIHSSYLQKSIGCGEEKLKQLFGELRRAGYVKLEYFRDEMGRITGSKRHYARFPIYLEAVGAKAKKTKKTTRREGKPSGGKPSGNNKTKATSNKTKNNNKPSQAQAASFSESDEASKHPTPTREMIVEVYEYWKQIMGRPRDKLTAKRADRIEFGLKRYGIEDCKKAIDGCKRSDFHQENIYTDIELILRNETKADRFIKLAKDNEPYLNPKTPLRKDYV